MFKSVSHYIQRSRELGPLGTLRRVWVRTTNDSFCGASRCGGAGGLVER